MNELETWIFMRNAYLEAIRIQDIIYNPYTVNGLCSFLSNLATDRKIPHSLRDRMSSKIDNYLFGKRYTREGCYIKNSCYLAKYDLDGASVRIEFCNMQIELINTIHGTNTKT